MMNIHPTAIVEPGVQLDEGVQIGPYSVVRSDVKIGKNTVIGPHVVIDSHTDIGANCRIFQFSSIGAAPQDLKYRGEQTRVIIGDNNVIREFVTINRSTTADIGMTKIGNNNLLMAYCHVAHNCRLGNFVVMANAANLAGHIDVEDYAIIGVIPPNATNVRMAGRCIATWCEIQFRNARGWVNRYYLAQN